MIVSRNWTLSVGCMALALAAGLSIWLHSIPVQNRSLPLLGVMVLCSAVAGITLARRKKSHR